MKEQNLYSTEKQFSFSYLSLEEKRPSFDCGERDLNEIFALESLETDRDFLTTTYVLKLKKKIKLLLSVASLLICFKQKISQVNLLTKKN